jgi:hypothetical protein
MTEGGTILTSTATSQANISVSYKPEIYEVLKNNEDDMILSLQNFRAQMTSAFQEQVPEQRLSVSDKKIKFYNFKTRIEGNS